MQAVARSLVLFIVAGLCEIGGGWLIWQFWRERRGEVFGLAGVIALLLYGVIPDLSAGEFCRVDAPVRRCVHRPVACLGMGGGWHSARHP